MNARSFKELALMTSTGRKETLLQVSARHAFWQIPKTGLRHLSRYFGAGVGPTANFPTLLIGCCEAVLGALSPEEQLRLMRLRIPKVDDMKEFFMSEEASDLLTEEDKKL